jgi:hypothetical protein
VFGKDSGFSIIISKEIGELLYKTLFDLRWCGCGALLDQRVLVFFCDEVEEHCCRGDVKESTLRGTSVRARTLRSDIVRLDWIIVKDGGDLPLVVVVGCMLTDPMVAFCLFSCGRIKGGTRTRMRGKRYL